MSVEMCRCRCGGGVNLIIIHSFTSLFNRYIQSLVEVNQAARKKYLQLHIRRIHSGRLLSRSRYL